MLCWGCRLGMWSLWRTPGTGTRGGTPCTTLSRQVLDQGAGYVLAPRGNRESLNDDVRLFLDDPATPVAQASQTNKGHGRSKRRCGRASGNTPVAGAGGGGQDNRQPPGRRSHQRGEPVLPAEPGIPAGAVQRHCPGTTGGIENRLHWMLDVVFNEDQSRNRRDHRPENLSLIRKLALNLARMEPSKGVHEGQAQTRRLGQWLSRHHPIPVHQNSNAIALERLLTAIDIPK